MKTEEIAKKLVDWCNQGEWEKCYQELYSPNIVSIESGDNQVSKGMEEVAQKGEWWKENFEVHSSKASEPIVADNWFTVSFTMDTTHKPSGQRNVSSEIAVYQVENGKIVREEFFYNQPQG